MEDIELEEQLRLLQEEQNNLKINLQEEDLHEIKIQNNIHKIIQRDIDIVMEENTNILHEYRYYDENENLLYRIVEQKNGERYVAQKYKNGKFIFGLGKETKRVPYNLPTLCKNNGTVVWIVNGEDKVDYLKSLGIIATTAPFKSATKWKKEFNVHLLNARAVIVLDENKEDDINYISKTFVTLKGDLENVGLVNLIDLANELDVNLSEDETLLKLAEKVNNNSKLKELLKQIEEQI